MRQRERIVRVVAEISEKFGLDPRQKFTEDQINDLLKRKKLDHDNSSSEDVKNSQEDNSQESQEHLGIKNDKDVPSRKNPFPPKRKKTKEQTSSSTDE